MTYGRHYARQHRPRFTFLLRNLDIMAEEPKETPPTKAKKLQEADKKGEDKRANATKAMLKQYQYKTATREAASSQQHDLSDEEVDLDQYRPKSDIACSNDTTQEEEPEDETETDFFAHSSPLHNLYQPNFQFGQCAMPPPGMMPYHPGYMPPQHSLPAWQFGAGPGASWYPEWDQPHLNDEAQMETDTPQSSSLNEAIDKHTEDEADADVLAAHKVDNKDGVGPALMHKEISEIVKDKWIAGKDAKKVAELMNNYPRPEGLPIHKTALNDLIADPLNKKNRPPYIRDIRMKSTQGIIAKATIAAANLADIAMTTKITKKKVVDHAMDIVTLLSTANAQTNQM